MKLLIVHVPRRIARAGRTERFEIMAVPVGVFALADFLDRRGFHTRILHLGIELLRDPDFSITDYISGNGYDAVALDLHWNHQVVDVLETVELIKKELPEMKVILGGLSASFWSEDLLEGWPAVDYVVRGEAEVPMLELARAIESGSGLESVPNLSWRRDGEIVTNELSYRISQEEFDSLDFASFPLLEHYEDYGGGTECPATDLGFEEYKKGRRFYLAPCRGCYANCAHCGGSRESARVLLGRDEPLRLGPEAALTNYQTACRYGFDKLQLSYEHPGASEEFYFEYFKLVRSAGIDAPASLDCAALPSSELVREFSMTFQTSGSELFLFCISGDERTRQFYQGFSYTNEELEETAALCGELGISAVLRVKIFPKENSESVVSFVKFLERIATRTGICVQPEFNWQDPACPWQLHPEKFEMETTALGVRDFFRLHSSVEERSPDSDFGYRFPGFRSLWDLLTSIDNKDV